MDRRISWRRLAMTVATAFGLGAVTPVTVNALGPEILAIIDTLKEYFARADEGLKKLNQKTQEVEERLNDIKRLHQKLSFQDDAGVFSYPEFLKKTMGTLGKLSDDRVSPKLTSEYRDHLGVSIPAEEPDIQQIEAEVRKAFVVVKDPDTEERRGEKQRASTTIRQTDLAKVHQQRGILLRNAALKGISLSLLQQNDMYSQNAIKYFGETKELLAQAQGPKDFAYVQTMVMLELVSELRQQRQLLAALLQSQAAHNLHSDPLLVDISPAPRRPLKTAVPSLNAKGLTDEEQATLDEYQKMNDAYRKAQGIPRR